MIRFWELASEFIEILLRSGNVCLINLTMKRLNNLLIECSYPSCVIFQIIAVNWILVIYN